MGKFSRLGGRDVFELAVEDFYRRVLHDAALRPYFEGIDVERLKRHQHAFIAMAVGGARGYLGRTMAAAHARLHVTDEAFDRVLDHLVGTLVDLGLDDGTVREVCSNLLPLRHDICERSEAMALQRH